MDKISTPKITLVGAGPGDEGLITLKGIQALERAVVVLYDDLANRALLDYCPQGTLKIYVGKRVGRHSFQQEEINSLLVRLARKRGHVVRLKGGDPFVFGRGYEEAEHARRHGIACEVVPGVSSCLAVPALQGIPVTSRGISESFWVITGTTRSGELSDDLHLAAQSNATVVVLMGMRKLNEICDLYARRGRGHLPMAVIQNGTRANELCLVGQAWEMPQLIEEYSSRKQEVGAFSPVLDGPGLDGPGLDGPGLDGPGLDGPGLDGPAILVIGEVVGLHPAYVQEYVRSIALVA